ncbi:MAG: DegT/DnrJ/EryC1/StrS family aminotransferase [Desulfobacter sp.]|nr:MAG: DegT/DnrJ/EryC1/StrS family aminotransferase [Desulfobacter sp.]
MSEKDHLKILPYGRQSVDENDVKAVMNAVEAPFLTTGPGVAEFEKKMCKITTAKYAVACASGTAALHLACMALGVKNGDLGLTSPISFLASANCVEYCRGQADFIDIDPSTLCLSPEDLDRYCRKIKVPDLVIPVDFAGVPADLPAIKKLSDQYGFKVIEDAAHALGSQYQDGGKTYDCGSCAHTDLAVFSFHPVKTVTTGEGGAVMTNDQGLAKRLRRLRSHGMETQKAKQAEQGDWYYEMTDLGYNYRITDLQCALGIAQLEKLSAFKAVSIQSPAPGDCLLLQPGLWEDRFFDPSPGQIGRACLSPSLPYPD